MNIEEVLASHGMGGKKGLVQRTGKVTLVAAGSTATIPVTYVASSEVLILTQNGTVIYPTTDYTVSGTTVTKASGTWDKGTILEFLVIGGSATPSGTFDGSLVSDGTVTDAKLHTDIKIGSLTGLNTTNKGSVVDAINEVAETAYNVYKSTPDAYGVYTVVEYKRKSNGTLYRKSTLSNPDANSNYQTQTIQYYNTAGTTVIATETWVISYDTDGNIVSEVKS